jgi:hypothetical protein
MQITRVLPNNTFKSFHDLRYMPAKDRKDEPQRTRMMGMIIPQMSCRSPWFRTLSGWSAPILPTRDSSAEPDAFLKP